MYFYATTLHSAVLSAYVAPVYKPVFMGKYFSDTKRHIAIFSTYEPPGPPPLPTFVNGTWRRASAHRWRS